MLQRGPAVLIWNRLLVGVDASEYSMAAVNYVSAVLWGSANCQVHLAAVYVPPSLDNHPEPEERLALAKKRKGRLEEVLGEAVKILEAAQLPPENISSSVLESATGQVGKALMKHQREHGFGTVVVGRRGLSKAEEFIYGSVSKTVVQRAHNCCVWVVG